jgi:hypothetical protein
MRIRLKALITGGHGRFEPGEIVSEKQMPKFALEQLVAGDYAELVGVKRVEQAVLEPPERADIQHIGGPWYMVKGRKVRGKAAAQAAAEG